MQRAAPAVDWLWSGAITAGSARVRARVTVPGAVRLILTHHDGRDAASPRIVAPTGPPSTDGVYTFDADGLQPDTAYRYAIESAGGRDERHGQFRTFKDGAFSFAFAFGSCASTGSNNLVFDVIRRRTPHFFLHLGDFHYANIARRRSVALPRRLEPRAALAAPVGALPRRRRSSTSSTTTTSAPTTPTAPR